MVLIRNNVFNLLNVQIFKEMKKLFWVVFLFPSISIALENNQDCEKIIEDNRFLSKEDRFKLALDYRDNYFIISKDKIAFCLLQDLYNKGYVDAGAALASFYNEGEFVEKNPEKAIEMTKAAAEKGSAFALNNLGSYYFNGVYIKQDFNKAIEYYNKAISQGNSLARVSLSYAYFTGQGVEKNVDKAIELASSVIKDPGNIGYTMALTNLGFYYGSLGVKEKQVSFMERAAQLYDANALINLGVIYATDYSFGDREKSLYWLNKAIERNNPEAYFRLAIFYDKGTPVFEKNNEKAMEFYLKAAELGNDNAQYVLGSKLFWHNQEREALKWFLKAANEHNNPNSIVSLYQIYSQGTKEIPQDLEKAKYWLEKAKENGFSPK